MAFVGDLFDVTIKAEFIIDNNSGVFVLFENCDTSIFGSYLKSCFWPNRFYWFNDVALFLVYLNLVGWQNDSILLIAFSKSFASSNAIVKSSAKTTICFSVSPISSRDLMGLSKNRLKRRRDKRLPWVTPFLHG